MVDRNRTRPSEGFRICRGSDLNPAALRSASIAQVERGFGAPVLVLPVDVDDVSDGDDCPLHVRTPLFLRLRAYLEAFLGPLLQRVGILEVPDEQGRIGVVKFEVLE